ncbi:MAG: hypothetical protein JWN40_1018 [Phycisphaerales bacterium]|nr:hypothetical protein [Phycisphaerales bacterium]
MKSYSNSAPPRPYRPIDYSKPSLLVECAQATVGAGLVFAALFAWQSLSSSLAGDNWRPWVLLGLFALLLIAIDALARAEWGWDRLRVGLVLGFFAVAGFWLVRLGLWGLAHWNAGAGARGQ